MTPHPPTGPAPTGPAASRVEDTAPEAFGLRIRETVSNFPPVESWDDVVAARREGASSQGREALHARPDHLLQLRVGLRAAGLRGPRRPVDQEARGQPGAPRVTRSQLREGPGDRQPGQRPRADPHPLRRVGERGSGSFEPVTWDEALDDIAARIRRAIEEDRRDEVIYHVGRPGEDGFVERVLLAWGVDGHNSHTNICSAGARLGYTLWGGYDRPSPDYANARGDPAHLQPPRDGALLQPARPADHGGQGQGRRQARRPGPATVEHRLARRPLDEPLAGQRGGDPAGDRVLPAAHRPGRRGTTSVGGSTGTPTCESCTPTSTPATSRRSSGR